MSTSINSLANPMFTRGEVAKILNVTPLTIANREKSEKYPDPKRDLNNYRIYTLNDVLNLQLLTYKALDPKPIISILYDKGFKDAKELGRIMDGALSRKMGA
jgi:DNA-binding transcriptional MerR regulator